jgi:hypothetical protein
MSSRSGHPSVPGAYFLPVFNGLLLFRPVHGADELTDQRV